jgi:hypothetical protein
MAQNSKQIADGLLENARDSIRHAMDHFSERRSRKNDSSHDDKWIVLSVHHTAECVCNALLLHIEPACPLFKGGTRYPHLTDSIKRLTSQLLQRPSPAESSLLALLNQLSPMRHEFMHRVVTTKVDVSIAAMCLIGILKHLELRYGTKSSEIVEQSPPIQTDIVEAIRWQKPDEYGKFVEAFLNEKYKNARLRQCPSCAVASVISSRCEACFEDIASISCPACDDKVLFIPWERQTGKTSVDCDCGKAIPLP